MKKTKKLIEGGLYVIQINSSANSAIVEKVHEAKKFLSLINNRLKGFAKIYHYQITSSSIFLMLQIENKSSVFQCYLQNRNKSTKANRELDLEETWKVISEQFRHIISMYVKWFNRRNNRSGSLVKKNYERFYFESLSEVKEYIDKMENEALRAHQSQKKYRPSKRVNGIYRKMGKGIIYLTSKHLKDFSQKRNNQILGLLREGSIKIWGISNEALDRLISETYLSSNQLTSVKNKYLC